MSSEYLFKCTDCGREFAVATNKAGMRMDCPFCETPNQLPGLRQLRLRPIAAENLDVSLRSRSGVNDHLFAGGLLVGVVAALLGFALARYADSLVLDSTLSELDEIRTNSIKELPPGQLWDAWDSMTGQGLGEWKELPVVKYSKQSVYLGYISVALYCVSVLGFLTLAVSFLGSINKPRGGSK